MNTSRRLFPCLAFAFLSVPLLASPITTYTDQSQFLSKLHSANLEDFSSTTLVSGLSVATVSGPTDNYPGAGHVADGAWHDCVGNNCDPFYWDSTTWKFGRPVYAFGATFDFYGPGAAGIALFPTFANDGSNAEVDVPLQDGFFGFVSTEAFSQVLVGAQYLNGYSGQPYTMDDLHFSADPVAPEPASWSLVGLAALCAVGVKRRSSFAKLSNSTACTLCSC